MRLYLALVIASIRRAQTRERILARIAETPAPSDRGW